jgi:hypothetical protein
VHRGAVVALNLEQREVVMGWIMNRSQGCVDYRHGS